MLEFLMSLFNTDDFPARWHCGQWSDTHGWVHITSDLMVFMAYMAIPVLLGIIYVRRRGDIPFPRIVALFVVFVFACGTTHLLEAIIFWKPMYRLAGGLKLITALVSWATVLSLIPVVPRMMSMRYPEALEFDVRQRTSELQLNAVALEQARGDLATSNTALQGRNSDMEEFVYTVSHDLRTPLVTMSGFVDLAAESLEGDPEETRRHLQRIRSAGVRMQALLEDLLTISRIGNGQHQPSEINLDDVVEGVLAPLRGQLEEDGIQVEIRGPLGTLWADRERLTQAMENLITNAIKYGKGQTRVSVEAGLDSIIVSVEDNGRGVPTEHAERVFQLFERLHSDEQGTGVGLAIVARVAERHGGRAWVDESDLGGARFRLEFPNAL